MVVVQNIILSNIHLRICRKKRLIDANINSLKKLAEHLKKFNSLGSRHVRGNFLLQRHDGPGVRDGQAIEVCVVLEDLHVAG